VDIVVFPVELPVKSFPELTSGDHAALHLFDVFHDQDLAQLRDIGRADQGREWIWEKVEHREVWISSEKNRKKSSFGVDGFAFLCFNIHS